MSASIATGLTTVPVRPGRSTVGQDAPRGRAEEPAPGSPSAAQGLTPNPVARVDWALNLVVLQFLDASGRVASSIPSARQLEAYRRAAAGAAAQPAS